MSDTIRKEIFMALDAILQEQPDCRFGQLVANLALYAKGPIKSATYDVEDDEFLEAATRHLDNLRKRREAKTQVQELIAQRRQKTAA